MRKGKPSSRARSHADGLTLGQQSAVDLLAAGKTDTETAEVLTLNRVTVTRWRLYSPEFRAALAVRRADVWGAAADRLRALVPKAVDALADALEKAPDERRVEVALAVLKLVGPLQARAVGSFDPEEYVRDTVARERDRARRNDDHLDGLFGLPAIEAHEDTVRQRLAGMSAEEPALNGRAAPR